MSYGKTDRECLQFPFQLDRMRVRWKKMGSARQNRVGRLARRKLCIAIKSDSEKFAANVSHSQPSPFAGAYAGEFFPSITAPSACNDA